MSAPDDDPRLIEVARSVADGVDVDWAAIRRQFGDDASASLLSDLQALAHIATFHRDTGGSGATTTVVEHDTPERTPLGTWRHLTLLEKIAEGAFGSVYRARDPKLETDVALKLVSLPADRSIDVRRALKEARLLARVRHPHVVRVHGGDIADGHVGIWMEFIDGQTLATLLRTQGPLGGPEAALIGCDLCQALAAVHHAGLIHGDVKAHNVMREDGGRTVLMDFGTGKDVTLQPTNAIGASDIAGTPLYLAPEVFNGEGRSTRTDIYSLGVLLYHLVTNGYPVDGRTQAEVEEAHRRNHRTRLRDARPDLPAALVDAVERAIAVDPHERFESAGAFEAALARCLGQQHEVSPKTSWKPWAVAATIAIAAATGVTRYWTIGREPAPVVPPPATARAVPNAASGSYRIATTLVRRAGAGGESPLRPGDRVAPGDSLSARLTVSAPTYVYIVNEDDHGESFLLFPLPGQAVENPILPGVSRRIPGTRVEDLSWRITSAGGREHFLIFASPERLEAFEDLFAALPRPSFATVASGTRLSGQAVARLRGVGGLAPSATHPSVRLASVFTQPLGEAEETTRGLWVRQLTVENPPPK